MTAVELASFLDGLLKVSTIPDSSNNGLQVEHAGKIGKICCGVDASMDFFREAKRRGADFLICHHGLSWGDSLKRITGLNYKRMSYLVQHGMALYACHLPLDAHPRYGNNAVICRRLGLQNVRPFGGVGKTGRLRAPVRREAFCRRVREKIHPRHFLAWDFGPATVRSVAVVSGAGTAALQEASRQGIDMFVTGEPSLSAYNVARDCGMNVVFAGHYATEVFGVCALGDMIRKRFGIRAEFVDLQVPY